MTTTWEVVHRPADGERVGYLAPAPASDGLVVPMTLAGTVVGGALAVEEATALLSARGLALLDGRWWCRLPSPLPRGLTDARDPAPDWPWQPTVLVEVSPTQLTLRPEWPAPGEAGALAVLPVPAGDLLRSEAP